MKYSGEDLAKLLSYEEKRGIKYAKSSGKLCNRLTFFGFIFWIWMIFTSFSYVISRILKIGHGIDRVDNPFISVIVSSSVALLSILFYIFRLKIVFFIVNIFAAIFNFVSFVAVTGVDDSITLAATTISEYDQGIFGLKKIFYSRHGIPAILLIILSLILIFLFVRERLILKKEFELITKNNYKPQIIADQE